jgi:RHS repeat-associated protein
VEVSADGRTVTFVPAAGLRYGRRYELRLAGLLDQDGLPLSGRSVVPFSTNLPRLVAHFAMDARDVITLPLDATRRLLAVAEGDAHDPDFVGGIQILNVTDLSNGENPFVWRESTAAVDRALHFTTGSAIAGVSGPFLMSVEGPGGPDRFGVWRLFAVTANATLAPVATRLVNQSAESLRRLSGVDSPLAPPSPYELSVLSQFVPMAGGVPEDVVSLGTQVAYVANAPHLGLQAINLQIFDPTFLAGPQIDGTLRVTNDPDQSFPIRAADVLNSPAFVVAGLQAGSAGTAGNQLWLVDPRLATTANEPLLLDEYDLGASTPRAVTALDDWLVRFVSADGFSSSDAPRDLAVAACQGDGLCVVPINANGAFDPTQLPGGVGHLRTPGKNPRGTVGAADRRLLYVADGDAGLAIVDFASPGGSIDEDGPDSDGDGLGSGDGIDDRVLGTVPLPDPWSPNAPAQPEPVEGPTPDGTLARARQVAAYRMPAPDNRPFTAVAAGASGLYLFADPRPCEVDKQRFNDRDCKYRGSVIGCENQTLGEVVGLIGTPFTLHYESDRVPGRQAFTVDLGDPLTPDISELAVKVYVADREFTGEFSPAAGSVGFTWDGRDAAGNVLLGAQPATVEVEERYGLNGDGGLWGTRVWHGTVGTWDTRAQGLGGWSVSVHHFYDPRDQVLHLGSGERRSGKYLGRVSEQNGEFLIPSEDGGAVYVFDLTGRHLRTVNALTNTTAYTFAYDAQGWLTTVTDANGNTTTIEHDAAGPTAIAGPAFGGAPFANRTTLTTNPAGFIASVSNPAGTAAFTYTTGAPSPFITPGAPAQPEPVEGPTPDQQAEGLLLSMTDPNGGESTYAYDAQGRLRTDTDAADATTTLTRTDAVPAAGVEQDYTVALTSAGGRTTTHRLQYFENGDEHRTITAPDGLVTEAHIGADLSQTVTFPEGSAVVAETIGEFLDVLHTLPGTLGTVETTHEVTLGDAQNPLSVTKVTDTLNVNNRIGKSVFQGNTVTATSPAGRQQVTTIDPQGRPTNVQLPGVPAVGVSYDGSGRPSSLTQGGRTMSTTYDGAYVQTVTDPLNRTVTYTRDSAGRVTTQTLPDGRVIGFGYDNNGNVTSITPPGRPAHGFDYTPVDLESAYAPPPNSEQPNTLTTYSYNADRELTSITRPDGQVINLTYDSAGRVKTVGPITYTYDALGHPTGVSSPGGSLTITNQGPLPTAVTSSTGTVSGTVSYGYDAQFNVTSLSVNGQAIGFGYDLDGLLTQAGDVTLSREQSSGILTGTTLGAVTDTYTRNTFAEPLAYTASHGTTTLYGVNYTRDNAGRITQKTETIAPSTGSGQATTTTEKYTYDPAGRLTDVRDANDALLAHYEYDANGNRIAGTVTRQCATVDATHDAQDRLLTFDCGLSTATYAYTANGDLQTKTDTSGTTTYTYDVFGNLRSVSLPDGRAIEYVIDAANRRAGKKINGALVQGFLYQDQLRPIAELDGAGTVVARFVYGSKSNVPDYLVKDGTTYRIISDHLGSPRLVVHVATGDVVQRMDYDEFGNVLTDTNPGFQPFGFAGGLYDADTGLVRFGARDYDAETGRWTAKDPIDFEGGDENLYAYTLSDPVNFLDPDGLNSVAEALRTGAELTTVVTLPAWVSPVGLVIASGAVGVLLGDYVNDNYIIANPFDYWLGPPGGLICLSEARPSGKGKINVKEHPTKKRAKDAARAEGKGPPVQHPSPKRGGPHFHPADEQGRKIPGSTHHEYPRRGFPRKTFGK